MLSSEILRATVWDSENVVPDGGVRVRFLAN